MTGNTDTKHPSAVTFIPLALEHEITPGDSLAELIIEAGGSSIKKGCIVVVTHKAAAKAEGRIVKLSSVTPSPFAASCAAASGKDPRLVELILSETERIVRMRRGCIIVKTKQGLTCANAGIDLSNMGENSPAPGEECACLLPEDPNLSARRIYDELQARLGFAVPVIISDSFGRPWREGIVNFAIGSSGLNPFTDYRGQKDSAGRVLKVTRMASADALAAGAELACGKLSRAPFVLVEGFAWQPGTQTAKDLLMPEEHNFFP